MTREEFIEWYLDNCGFNTTVGTHSTKPIRTDKGFSYGKYAREAVPCDCREPFCRGWIMKRIE